MENRIAILAVIVENPESTEQLNSLLHTYRSGIIGRMGLPYEKRDMRVISIIMDAPADVIGYFTGKVSRMNGVTANYVHA